MNLVKNSDFSENINQSKKRGVWMLNILAEKGGSSPYDLAPSGFVQNEGTLEIDMGELNPSGLTKVNQVTMNQITPPLVPGKQYQLSFEAWGSEPQSRIHCGVGVMVNAVGATDGGLAQQSIELGTEQKRYAFDFTAEPVTNSTADPQKYTRVDFRFGEARGKLFIRDIRLIEKE